MISEDRPTQRATEFVAVVVLLLVLNGQHGGVVDRAELQALHWRGGDRIAREVIVPFPREPVPARLGHGADAPAERAPVLRGDAAGLYLHFLQIFEDGVLAR